MSDAWIQFAASLLTFLAVMAGIWKQDRDAKFMAAETMKNRAATERVHDTVNGALSAARAATKEENDRLLEVSTAAARAEGALEEKSSAAGRAPLNYDNQKPTDRRS